MGHFVEEGLCWGSFGFSTKLPPNSTISMFGPSPIRHSSRADLVYMCTSTGSAVLGIYSSSPDPSAADVQGFNFCQMLEHSASIQSSAAQSRQEIRHCHNNITSGNFFQNKTLCVNTSTKNKVKIRIQALLLILWLGTLTFCPLLLYIRTVVVCDSVIILGTPQSHNFSCQNAAGGGLSGFWLKLN